MARSFVVNNTLAFLRLSKTRMRVVAGRGGRLGISVSLTRTSDVTASVRTATGRRIRLLSAGESVPGLLVWRWDGRRGDGTVVRSGTYRIRVRATNALGTVALTRSVKVVRS
jgi:flagellar hook assembly protein FlgD